MNGAGKFRDDRGRRGAALITVVFVATFLAALLAVAFAHSYSSSRMAVMRENYAKAVAAAEYGAELALAQLLHLQREGGEGDGKGGQIKGDFVFGEFSSSNSGNMYATSSGKSDDQRRIAGIMDDQQFRVKVRSARLAHDNNNVKDSWLNTPAPFDYADAVNDFRDTYEVTATAQNHLAASGVSVQANLYPISVVRTVVTLDNSGAGAPMDEMGALDADPEYIQASNMLISGEDHNLRQFYIPGGEATDASYTKVGQSGTSSADFAGVAEGTYWKTGNINLNYMRGDVVVPFYPFSKTPPADAEALDSDNRKMVSIGTYIVDDPLEATVVAKTDSVRKEKEKTDSRLTIDESGGDVVAVKKVFIDDSLPDTTDIYLVGGKTAGGQGHSAATFDNHPWLIERDGVKFDIVLGDFDDLLRIYLFRASEKNNPAIKPFKLGDDPESYSIYGTPSLAGGIPEDANVDMTYLNFVGRKLLEEEVHRVKPMSMPSYADPFDNNQLNKRFQRYFGRQYVMRTNPVTKNQEMLVMNLKEAKYIEARQYMEAIMVNKEGKCVGFSPWLNVDDFDDWPVVGWSSKKVLWEISGVSGSPVKFKWDAGRNAYWPVEATAVIKVLPYPRDYNSENVPYETLEKIIDKIWPGILATRHSSYTDSNRTYVLDWSRLVFNGADGLVPFTGIQYVDVKDPWAVPNESEGMPDFPGLYINQRHPASAPGGSSGQLDWDGTYTWSEFENLGDEGTVHFENPNDGSNIIPRPFDLDEILGMKLDHDFDKVWAKRYSLVSVVDEEGKTIVKNEKGEYPGHIPVPLTGPVRDNTGAWSGHRGDAAGEFGLEPDLGLTGLWVWEPNDDTQRPYDPQNPEASNPRLFRTIDDFLENKTFADLERKALTLWVGVEDAHPTIGAWTADWDYNDVAFIVSIAPPIPGDTNRQMINNVETYNAQWWEQNEKEGLTGGEANAAISTNRIDGSDDAAKAYAKLWNKLTIDDWFGITADRRQALRDKAGKMGVKTDGISDAWFTAASKADFPGATAAAFEEIKGTIIAVLSSDVYSMMSKKTGDFTDFYHRGDFYCTFHVTKWSKEAQLPVAVHLRNERAIRENMKLNDANNPDRSNAVYYSDNDVEYYRAVCDTVYSEVKNLYFEHMDQNGGDDSGFDGGLETVPGTEKLTRKGFMKLWESLDKEGRRLYAKRKLVYHLSGVDSLRAAGDKDLFEYKSSTTPGLDESSVYHFEIDYIDQREDDFYNLLVAVNSGEDGQLNSLKIRQKGIHPREYAAAFFNQKETLVRQGMLSGVTTDLNDDDEWELFKSPSGAYRTKGETLTFLAGEMRQAAGEKTVSPLDDPIPFNTNYKRNGEPYVISPRFLAGSEDPDSLSTAVMECYKRHYNAQSGKVDEIHGMWGLKDNRRSIGWHRYGSSEDEDEAKSLAELNLLDNLEVTMLGVRNFMPYYTVKATDGGPYVDKTLVQKRRVYDLPATDPEFSETKTPYTESIPLRTCGPEGAGVNDRKGEDLPTFVFPPPKKFLDSIANWDEDMYGYKDMFGPIDGAGIMVVNGNLLVKDTFAFHGILIVLGALGIQGTYNPDRILYGDDGNPYFSSKDGKNYSLRRDAEGFYYEDENGDKVREHTYVDADGATHTEKVDAMRAKDDPDASDYSGRVVVQGGVVAGGEITTTSEDGKGPAGSFEVYHSQTVKDELARILPPGTPYIERLVWDHNDNINVSAIWNDELDRPEGGGSGGTGD